MHLLPLAFEHSVANMYFLQFGNFTFLQILENIIIVTFGNIIGGGVFVGIVYWILYLRPMSTNQNLDLKHENRSDRIS